ncbi:MAG: SUMF1/EgtB/PvdO family nonheme iron enzyme, partial [Gemmatimonadales bacterium]
PGSDLRALARLARRPRYAVPAAVVLVAALAAVVVPQRTRAARERALALLSQATQLADSNRWVEAYERLVQAERALSGDSSVARLMPRVADLLTVTSEPAGAEVYVRRFEPEASGQPADSIRLGVTPIVDRRLARGDYHVVVAKQGYVARHVLATRTYARVLRPNPPRLPPIVIDLRLFPTDSAPPDMVFVPGGVYQLVGPDMPARLDAPLDDYFIDRYEVSNEQYKAFVTAGGYQRPEYWRARLATAPAGRLADRTGMPGPRGWAGQDYPAGRGRYPVTDVSWDEAAAYCAFARKSLPTVFQWEKAARNGLTASGEGVMMPWGRAVSGEPTGLRANFGSTGPAPVDAYPFGISPFGAHNLAGNVKEWTANPLGAGYGVTGGSWADPIYLYSAYGAVAPTASAPTLGFRCARVRTAAGGDQGGLRIRPERRTPRYNPVAAAAFPALLAHYRYDRRPMDTQVAETVETPDWVREKIRLVAVEGDTALVYLYLPRLAAKPLQTMVYVASSGAFFQIRTVPEEVEWVVGPNIRAGRAVLAVVFRGMAERGFGPGWNPPPSNSVRFRDLMVLHATEMRRAIDYLATRDDIDLRRLAYVAVSWGAGSRLPLAAVDDRFRAVILVGGGIDERLQPTLPEAANYNFAPFIRAPKLLLNGRDDEEHPWFTRALPLWVLLREPKKLVLVEGAGHVPPLEARVPAINEFLDQTLGPVARPR